MTLSHNQRIKSQKTALHGLFLARPLDDDAGPLTARSRPTQTVRLPTAHVDACRPQVKDAKAAEAQAKAVLMVKTAAVQGVELLLEETKVRPRHATRVQCRC